MAIYHFTLKAISRRVRVSKSGRVSGPQSAVASAAYRSGEKLHDPRLGKDFDYTLRGQAGSVEHTEIMLPYVALADGGAPAWATNRQDLWAHVEQFEKRADAGVAREIEIALPHEFNQQQRIDVVRDFVRSHITDKGMIADVALHTPDEGKKNWHAHIMMTMRPLQGQEFGEPPKLKTERLTGKRAGEKVAVHAWADKRQMQEWREQWANTLNRHLERNNCVDRVDHRSNKERGIDREPISISRQCLAMEAKGIRTVEGDKAREAQLQNLARGVLSLAVGTLDSADNDIDRHDTPRATAHAITRLETLMEEMAADAPRHGTGDALTDAGDRGVKVAGKLVDGVMNVAHAVLSFFELGGSVREEPRQDVDKVIAYLEGQQAKLRNMEQDTERQRQTEQARHFGMDDDGRDGSRERDRDR